MWRSSWARVLVWFVALAGLSLFATAQEKAGNIYGHAVDDPGQNVPDASVTLTGPYAPRTTTTDQNGRFRFLEVPPGRYTILVSKSGFATYTRENVVVTVGKNTDVDVAMKLASVEASVTVTSTTPLLDSRKTETGDTFAHAELENIPTTRDIYAWMQQVPGVQMDVPNTAGIHSADIGGPYFISKGSGQGAYTLDGATITDASYGNAADGGGSNGASPLYFDFDTFAELQIATGGSNLELQTPGATINVVTKRGTNAFKGSGRYYYTSQNWESSNLSAEAASQGLQTDSIRFVRDYGAEIGGPIFKDHLWIWGAASRQDFGLNTTGYDFFGNLLQEDIKVVAYNAKLNGQITPSNAANFSFTNSDRTELGAGASDVRPPETTRNIVSPSYFYKLEDSQVFSDSLFASLIFSYLTANYTAIPRGGDVQADYYDNSWHNSYLFYSSKNPQKQAIVNATKFFNTGSVSHELKFGFGYRQQNNDSSSSWPGQGVWGYASSSLVAITRGVNTRYKIDWMYGFLGDTLTAGNLTVSAGLRYDYQRGKNVQSYGIGNGMFPELLPTVSWPGDQGYPFTFKNLEPRVSATYAIGKNKNTLVRASYSRFADQLDSIVYTQNAFPSRSGVYYYWYDGTNGNPKDNMVQKGEVGGDSGYFYRYDPFTLPNVPNQITSNYTAPTTDEFLIGVDQQIMEDFAVSLAYTYRYFKNLNYYIPSGTNLGTYAQAGTATGVAVGVNGFTLPFSEPFYGVTLPEQPSGYLYLNRPGANNTFNGIELAMSKRLSNRWMLRASFAWQNWRQNLSASSYLNANNNWNQGQPNVDGGIAVGYGRNTIWFNADWQFNVTGLYQLPLGINFAANFFGRQGYPAAYYVWNIIPSDNSAGTLGDSEIDVPIGQLNDFRLPNVYELDLRLEKTFQIAGVAITPMVDVFNVTNQGTVLQRDNLVGKYTAATPDEPASFDPNTKFNTIIETQSPRIMRLGIRVSF